MQQCHSYLAILILMTLCLYEERLHICLLKNSRVTDCISESFRQSWLQVTLLITIPATGSGSGAFSLALIRSICWRGQELQLTTRWWYSRSPLADGVIPYGHLTQIFTSNRAASQSVNNKPAWNHFNMLVVVSLYVNVIGHYYS